MFEGFATINPPPERMKTKLTLTVEKELINQAKTIAYAQNTSVSSLVESVLSNLILKRQDSFSERWRGSFKQTPNMGNVATKRPTSLHRR